MFKIVIDMISIFKTVLNDETRRLLQTPRSNQVGLHTLSSRLYSLLQVPHFIRNTRHLLPHPLNIPSILPDQLYDLLITHPIFRVYFLDQILHHLHDVVDQGHRLREFLFDEGYLALGLEVQGGDLGLEEENPLLMGVYVLDPLLSQPLSLGFYPSLECPGPIVQNILKLEDLLLDNSLRDGLTLLFEDCDLVGEVGVGLIHQLPDLSLLLLDLLNGPFQHLIQILSPRVYRTQNISINILQEERLEYLQILPYPLIHLPHPQALPPHPLHLLLQLQVLLPPHIPLTHLLGHLPLPRDIAR